MATKYVVLSLQDNNLVNHQMVDDPEIIPNEVEALFEPDENNELPDTVRVFAITDQPASSVLSSVELDGTTVQVVIVPLRSGADVAGMAAELVELHLPVA